MAIKMPPAVNLEKRYYAGLKGVDFSVDPSLVDAYRSPKAINMISDNGGNPIKRKGYRMIAKTDDGGKINGIFFAEISGKEYIIVHGGTKIYSLVNDETVVLKEDVNDAKSTSFFMGHGEIAKLYILTGKEYLSFDGEKILDVTQDAYIPTITISKSPTGGGTFFEDVNLLSPKKKESFLGNDKDKIYQLSTNKIDSVDKIESANANGGFDVLTADTHYTVDLESGKITFTAVHPPVISGSDNIIITYSKTVEGYKEKITNCTICTLYGVGGNNRVFLSGNSKYKAQDYYSGLFDPSYFPDLGYAIVGGIDTAIMGYQKIGEYLSIVKEENSQDTTVFFRSGTTDSKGEPVFSVKSTISGTGAISKNCFVNLNDEPLMLTRQGIFAITTTNLSTEKTSRNRSYYIDNKLLREKNLENAIACEHNGYYILAINGHCYILDSRNKSADKNGNTDFLYECYYWDNVHAICFLSYNENLYFGTGDGGVFKFNFDIEHITSYSDCGTLGEGNQIVGGKAIYCCWCTPNDNDNATQYYKTLQKKGCLITISPYDRSSGNVHFIVDGNPEIFIKSEEMDIFNWEDINFERFTFNSNTSPQEIYLGRKQKKYKRLQIKISNDGIYEGFGIHEIVKTFAYGNFSKNK